MRVIKGIFILFLFFIIIIVGIGIYLTTQTDEVQKIVSKEINDIQHGKFSFTKATVTNLKGFPNITLVINDLIVSEPPGQGIDTILRINKTYLEFDIRDFWKKNYTVKSVSVVNGFIKIKTYYDGSNSLKIFQSGSAENKLMIKLKDINLSRIQFYYLDSFNKNFAFLYVKKLKTSGKIDFSDLKVDVKANIYIHNVLINNEGYIKNSQLNLASALNFNKKVLSVNNCIINLDGLNFTSDGKVHFETKNVYYNMILNGKKIDINSLYQHLPEGLKKKINIKNLNGLAGLSLFIKGYINTNTLPDIKAFFSTHNANIQLNYKTLVSLSNLNLEGFYSNGTNRDPSSSFIKIDKAEGVFDEIDFSGNAYLLNFINPVINYDLAANFSLSDLTTLLPGSWFSDGDGNVNASFKGQFLINSLDSFKIINHEMFDIAGYIEFFDAGLKIKNNALKQLNGKLFLSDNILINNLSGILNNNSVLISGSLNNNFSDFLLKDRIYEFNGKVLSNKLLLTDDSYLGLINNNNTNDSINDLPDNVKINLQFEVDTLIFKQFKAYNVNSKIIYQPKNFNFFNTGFNINDGRLTGSMVIAQTSFNTFFIKAKSQFTGVDISNLFKLCNNFNQKTLTHNEISGILNGNLIVTAEFNNNLSIQKEKLKCTADIKIENGKLTNFEPAYKLSKYIDIKELEEIKFSTLSNVFEINNKQISFPEMEIFSSTYNIKLQGVHGFDNTFTYNLDLLLSEILSKKARTKNYANNNEVFNTKGQIKIPLVLFGNINNTQVKFNFKKALSTTKDGLNNEKDEIKQVLYNEFKTPQKNGDDRSTKNLNTPFEIQWIEEEDSAAEEFSDDTENVEKTSGFEIIWDEDD